MLLELSPVRNMSRPSAAEATSWKPSRVRRTGTLPTCSPNCLESSSSTGILLISAKGMSFRKRLRDVARELVPLALRNHAHDPWSPTCVVAEKVLGDGSCESRRPWTASRALARFFAVRSGERSKSCRSVRLGSFSSCMAWPPALALARVSSAAGASRSFSLNCCVCPARKKRMARKVSVRLLPNEGVHWLDSGPIDSCT